jgi:hypothetical protein
MPVFQLRRPTWTKIGVIRYVDHYLPSTQVFPLNIASAVRLHRHLNFLSRAGAAVSLSVCDPSGLRMLSRRVCRCGADHRGCRALAARIHASRSVLGVPVGTHRLFCELQGACVSLGEADTAARGRELRHGCGGYASHGGVVVVWVGRLDWKGGVVVSGIFLSCLSIQSNCSITI